MRSIIILSCIFVFSWSAFADNAQEERFSSAHPIMLVHGFTGWGPDEMLGYKYWGGTALDIEKFLQDKGFEVYVASVGPISSNHDRACELFYQIKGGMVDYGVEHVEKYRQREGKKFHHNRYGKTFKGYFPQWDADHPIHLVGHSMGGQTSRLLVELLARDYFEVGSNATWVKSVTTIATPNNGTTLATMINKLAGGYTERLLVGLLALAGTDWEVYDFDLDHWNLKPKKDESLHDFLTRIDELVHENKDDFAMFEFLQPGAKSFNARVRTFPGVYYFSYATEETEQLTPDPGYEWPKTSMTPLLWPLAYYIGHYKGAEISPANEWWKNDGIVNTHSMKWPLGAPYAVFSGSPKKGMWNFMGILQDKDHLKVVGHFILFSDNWLESFYFKLADMLYTLPQ